MAQTGYTPIQLYYSSTTTNAPLAANLASGELAINITDGKLFYKDNANAVQVIGWKVTPTTAGGTGLTSYTAGDTVYYASGTTFSKLAIGAAKTINTSTGSAPQWVSSLDTSQGGTGVTTYTAGDLTYYASGTTFTKLAIGTADYVMTSSGSAPQWSASLKAKAGGTGQTSYAVGDLLYADTTTTLAKLADVATGNALISGGVGVAPSWGKIGLTTHVSGTLPVANGGTNLTSFTANGVVYASSTSALATGTALNFNGTALLVARTNATFYGGAANFGVEQTSGSSWGIGVNANGNAVVFNHTANTSSSVGGIAVTTSSTSYVTSSDYRLKNTIAPMTGALAKVAQLKPVTYKWNVDGSDGQGFIAHELAEVCPDAVTGEKDGTRIEQYEISPAIDATYDENGNELTAKIEAVMGERVVPSYQGIDVSFLVATLTAAIQELKAEFDAYKATHS